MSIVTENSGENYIHLTYDEKSTFGCCEDVILRGLKTFVEVGDAFAVIRDSRLYRETHSTFEFYCTERWGIDRTRAYQLIVASEVVRDLSTIVDTVPGSESVARPLAPLPTEQRQEAWTYAVNNSVTGRPTALQVKESVEYVRHNGAPLRSAAPLHAPFTSSKSDEHYTPQKVIEAVLECFDNVIDLDPCSNSQHSPNVPAKNHYIVEDDGLTQPWKAEKVYMNPPYSEVKVWLQKLIAEYDVGNVTEAIALVKADTSTQWFGLVFAHATAICFVHHRLSFHAPGGTQDNSATFASAVAYFGRNVENFYQSFEETVGVCVQRIEPEMLGE